MAKQQRILLLKTGEKFPIVGEKGRYWLCKEVNFIKSNPKISEIITAGTTKVKRNLKNTSTIQGNGADEN